jgi:prefoldin subunit 5
MMEKHAKHVEDLKKYYGAEIASLSKKLSAMEREITKSPPARQNLNFDDLHRSPVVCARCNTPQEMWGEVGGGARNAADLAELQALKSDSERLEEECGKLRKRLNDKTK